APGGSGPAAAVAGFRAALVGRAVPDGDAERVELLAELERLKAAAAAVQARLAAAMVAEHAGALPPGRGPDQVVRSVAGQVGLARRVSPHRGQSLVGLARALCEELPCTLAALAAGEISEWQAMLVARETAVLAPADRRTVDLRLSGQLGRLGDRAVAREACRLADAIDPQASARRVQRAEADRRVSVRPAPGPAGCAMARLVATMPVAQAVGAYAALRAHAQAARALGDPRGLGQLMSDALFARLTGAATPAVAVEVGLVMSERSLLRQGRDPGVLTDDHGRAFGQVPAVLARALVRQADRAWLSRLYAAPATGELVAMDSRRRAFSGRLRRLLVWRDQTCRMPWCEAPIRHGDHVLAHAAGGPTGLANGAGLCESCNHLKEAPGWRAEVIRPGHVIAFTTPSGHRYESHPPPAPGHYPRSLDEHLERTRDDWDDGIGAA
ncbi:MAG: HNH endonuclease, partial [Candidatus Nanopelagicales bacterium]|nr:HNH endonuclease [Candidatus Nanopelagicales bacterium]